MKRPYFLKPGTNYWGLKCPACGNADRFLEVMAYELHQVDGMLNYLHLVAAETAQYRCWNCDKIVQPANHTVEE